YRTLHPNPVSNIVSREKMTATIRMLYKKGLLVISEKHRQSSRERMTEYRRNPSFNQKMFSSFARAVTKPHRQIKELLMQQNIKTETNYSFLFGNRFGSIDEADPNKKIAISIDGAYWHNYPQGKRWDKFCTTYLTNKGWKVLRFWDFEI